MKGVDPRHVLQGNWQYHRKRG